MNNLSARVEKRISSKKGKEYYVLLVKLSSNYEKEIFLDKCEVALIQTLSK